VAVEKNKTISKNNKNKLKIKKMVLIVIKWEKNYFMVKFSVDRFL